MKTAFLAVTSVLMLASPSLASAQEPGARNALYFELGGNALLYSANYERRLSDGFAARAGLMYVSANGEDEEGNTASVELAVIPIMANWLLGDGAGRFELGIGPLFMLGNAEVEEVDGSAGEIEGFGPAGVTSTIGYRYQPEDGGVVFRVGAMPFWSGDPGIWGGISLGWAF